MAAVRKRKESERRKDETKNGYTSPDKSPDVEYPAKLWWWQERKKKQEIQKFYEEQEELKEWFDRDRELMLGQETRSDPEKDLDVLYAQLSFALNIASLFANLAAAVLSGSLSVMSTFVDSSMDIACSVIMNVCLRLVADANSFNYPRGRERLELLGVLLCSIIMGIANVGMVIQSVNAIVNDTVDLTLSMPTAVILITQTVLKIILCTLCYRRGSKSSVCLAMDMRNDIVTRSVALVCVFAGDRFWRFADPLGAVVVCSLIAVSWLMDALENIPMLVGKRAEKEHLARILNITLEHDHRIRKIDHVMVYHTGQQALVELHIVMDEHLPLKITHDISHPLEKKLQRLEFVERAFVHCDYDCDGD